MPSKSVTEFVVLQGKTMYFRHKTPDMKFDPPRWKHMLFPNPESLEKMRELQSEGVKNVIKKDPKENAYYVNLSRPTYREYTNPETGVTTRRNFDAPTIWKADGKTPWGDELVGNGSDVTTKLEVYTHRTPGGGKAKACRWLSSKIDNLVPYNPERDNDPYENAGSRDMDKQPAQEEFF